ncbi:hypothetical protein EUBDOL_01427 [Amedibacillus dolichus DSM 3991]|uniref:Uncharacterized protein n=1 Tax=Amedibacillus dolichus DSM 3991 TaxID=428127 RepID=A8RCK6_9FIRM|nr:hypothetical protein EUBDOL_01427 [Amedibacillus dolichus DSM 3991]
MHIANRNNKVDCQNMLFSLCESVRKQLNKELKSITAVYRTHVEEIYL